MAKRIVKPNDQETLEHETPKEETIKFEHIISRIFSAYGEEGTDELQRTVKKMITDFLKQDLPSHIKEKYNVLILYDQTVLLKQDSDSIYKAINKFPDKKPLLLILYSHGGDGGSAYLIGKLCREYSASVFHIVVPRSAKSAATLLCCAADEIHMGSLSELGPIDPQIHNMPALGLKNSIEHIAALVKENPEASDMLAKYLHLSLKPIDLGYYERVAESAMQYAERLLKTHESNLPKDAAKIAYELVYSYKDHGFVIDKEEAQKIFGKK